MKLHQLIEFLNHHADSDPEIVVSYYDFNMQEQAIGEITRFILEVEPDGRATRIQLEVE